MNKRMKYENAGTRALHKKLQELEWEISQKRVAIENATEHIKFAEEEKAQILEVLEAYKKVMS